MSDLSNRGAGGILFGCTEIDLLAGRQDSPVPVFDTTRLHAQKAVQLALEGYAAPTAARALGRAAIEFSL